MTVIFGYRQTVAGIPTTLLIRAIFLRFFGVSEIYPRRLGERGGRNAYQKYSWAPVLTRSTSTSLSRGTKLATVKLQEVTRTPSVTGGAVGQTDPQGHEGGN